MASFDLTSYGQKLSSLGSQYGAKAAQNAYAQFLSQQRGARKKFDFQQQYNKQAPRVVSGFAKRGLAGPGVSSGVYGKGMQDYASQIDTAWNDLNLANADELNRLRMSDITGSADYNAAWANEEFKKAQNIADTAATLTAFKPFLGA